MGVPIAAVALLSAQPALAIEVELSPAPGATPAPGAAPRPPATGPAPPPAPASPAPAVARLRTGSRGPMVRDLQIELRRRGARLRIDGAFGPATRHALVALQRRLRVRPTGVADRRLLRRLGLRTREAADAAGPMPTASSSRFLRVFPVAGDHSFSDDWGAPRAQGGHEGTDVMADRGVPVVAVVDALVDRLTRTETGLGGIYVWLRRADGTEYYYAHLESIAPGLAAGSPVRAGDVIGANGNSGDARFGPTHVHFEIHPGGGRPINPFPHLVAVDPDR